VGSSVEHEIQAKIEVCHTSVGRIIILTDKSGSELGRVDLVDGIDLSYFLSQTEVEDGSSKREET